MLQLPSDEHRATCMRVVNSSSSAGVERIGIPANLDLRILRCHGRSPRFSQALVDLSVRRVPYVPLLLPVADMQGRTK